MNSNETHWVRCTKCGKKIIKRKENGLFHFVFGSTRDDNGNLTGQAPVDMYVYGSVKLKCLRRECGAWNVLNYFPFIPSSIESAPAKRASFAR